MTLTVAPFVLSSKGGAEILRGLVAGGEVRRDEGCWRFTAPSSLWPRECLDEVDIEWLLDGGLAYIDSPHEAERLRVVLTSSGRERLDRAQRSLFALWQIMPVDAARTELLRKVVGTVRSQFPDLFSIDLAFVVAQHILLHTFGVEWMERHLGTQARLPDFFRARDGSSEDRIRGIVRTIQLAEMIFNLQDHAGIRKSIHMIEDGHVESGFAELEVAKLLSVNGRDFRFIEPRGVKGNDYDLEVILGDVTVCAEAKCKIEDTEQSVKTVVGTLETARDQLPPDKPGIIVVSIPSSWGGAVDDGSRGQFLEEAVSAFFGRGTGRIVSVAAYTSLVVDDGLVVAPSTYTAEYINPRHRFRKDIAWRMFGCADKIPGDWTSLTAECE